MKKIISCGFFATLISVTYGYSKPEYAPEYVPPAASGQAEIKVGAEGADLSGAWTIRLDDEKKPVGEQEQWFDQMGFKEKINLPDALQNAGFGSPVTVDTEWMGVSGHHLWFTKKYDKYREEGNIKVPFFLQPERRFIGDAWYQKTIVIGKDAPKNKDLILALERPHWSSTVWLDGEEIGTNNSLGVPHVFNLGKNLNRGAHNLVVKVNNTLLLPVGSRAHSVSDETQGAWNGIIGDINLSWRAPVFIQHVKVETDYRTRSAKLELFIENNTGAAQKAGVQVLDQKKALNLSAGLNEIAMTVNFGAEAELWREFHPVLHDLDISLKSNFGAESKELKVGLRSIEAEGQKFLVNGNETFMRGTLDCCIFPKTGYPPMDKETWLEHLGKMKASGINHVRFHSWCPPKAAFEAGDELGMYLMPEIHIWGNPSDPAFGTWVVDEGKRIIDEYGNHPSFIFFTHGNEPWRGELNSTFLSNLTKELRTYDSRMLHTASANTIQSEFDEFTCTTQPRGRNGWKGVGFNVPHNNPFIQHEAGQWCAYPNFDEMKKYIGPLKPKNFEIFLEQAEENGVLPLWKRFLHASGKLQMLCYKEDCEAALASDGISGTQLLGISDFSGQGTSLVGYLDAFMDEKGYFTKAQFFKFWNWSVPLARMSSYVYKNADSLNVPVIYAYFGEGELKNQTLIWEVKDASGKVCIADEFMSLDIKSGRNQVGAISTSLKSLSAPANYTLLLRLKGTEVENSWEFMVCEDAPKTKPGNVMVHRKMDAELEAALKAGKSVLFMPEEYSRAHPKLSFEPVYWNKFLFAHNKDRVTLGLLIDDAHPVFNNFPTAEHTTWGWENILGNSYGLVMQELPQDGIIVRPIDDWNENRQLGFIMEYKVGKGKILVCMADLFKLKDHDPAARQLLNSLLGYMNSRAFAPDTEMQLKDLSDALSYSSNTSMMLNIGARIQAVNHAWKKSQGQAIDGDEGTDWLGKFDGSGFITIDLGKETTLQGLLLTNTNLKEFEVYHGNDLKNLTMVTLKDADFKDCMSLTLDADAATSSKKVWFKGESVGRYLRIYIKSLHGRTIKFGEIDVIFVIM
ncbi:discoidin domain-containing protein [Pontiella sulfatireligans]|uniref:beta-galactosidase n=1 Tax=Pontiella sulfatireligans TaxID=2750658 RepID=A0A6C2UH81_9BACT|nr:discoidin domain-containing protein [Pontiella sulfatireligans]VGO18867.1 Beta-galactosidase [Pontiella sulfatireligans]